MVCEEFKDGYDLGEVGFVCLEVFVGDEVDEDFVQCCVGDLELG